MGKTETIKERAVWVYLPTMEQRKDWERIAKTNGISLSKWIVSTVEDSISHTEETRKSRKELEDENQNLRKEIGELQDRLRQVTIIRVNLEKDIRRYRAEPFTDSFSGGIRRYDKELIAILRDAKAVDGKHRFVDNDEILSRLGVKHTEPEYVQSISSQLSYLEHYGLVESSTKGWRWKE